MKRPKKLTLKPIRRTRTVIIPELLVFTSERLAAAFTEWDRRCREEPEKFQSEAVLLLKETPKSYGEACAPYLIALLTKAI